MIIIASPGQRSSRQLDSSCPKPVDSHRSPTKSDWRLHTKFLLLPPRLANHDSIHTFNLSTLTLAPLFVLHRLHQRRLSPSPTAAVLSSPT